MKYLSYLSILLLFVIINQNTIALSTNPTSYSENSQHIDDKISIKLIGTDASCNSVCNGEVLAIASGAGPFFYRWSNGAESSSIKNLCAGDYLVTVTNGSGDIAKAEITISEPSPITGETYVVNPTLYQECNGSIEITNVHGGTPPYRFLWNTGDITPNYLGICGGLHTVTITDDNDCSAEINFELTGTKDCADFGAENGNFILFCKPPAFQEENIVSNIYPNPIADEATIEFSTKESGLLKIVLYNSSGVLIKTLFNEDIKNGQLYKVTINVRNLKEGIYHYHILTDNISFGKPFIVTH